MDGVKKSSGAGPSRKRGPSFQPPVNVNVNVNRVVRARAPHKKIKGHPETELANDIDSITARIGNIGLNMDKTADIKLAQNPPKAEAEAASEKPPPFSLLTEADIQSILGPDCSSISYLGPPADWFLNDMTGETPPTSSEWQLCMLGNTPEPEKHVHHASTGTGTGTVVAGGPVQLSIKLEEVVAVLNPAPLDSDWEQRQMAEFDELLAEYTPTPAPNPLNIGGPTLAEFNRNLLDFCEILEGQAAGGAAAAAAAGAEVTIVEVETPPDVAAAAGGAGLYNFYAFDPDGNIGLVQQRPEQD